MGALDITALVIIIILCILVIAGIFAIVEVVQDEIGMRKK